MTSRVAAPMLAWILTACSQAGREPAVNAAAVSDSIRAAMTQYLAAHRSNDPAAVTAFWADDAVYMDPAMPTVVGRAAFDSMVAGVFATARVTSLTENTDEILVDRDMAVQRGTFDETIQPQRGAPVTVRGRYIFVWRRQADGSWKVARGMGTPMPPDSAAAR